jgi:integrase
LSEITSSTGWGRCSTTRRPRRARTFASPGARIALSDETRAALKGHRHLRGPLVFSDLSGRMLKYTEMRHPLWRACRKAGLRPVGWHTLRHSFARVTS